MSEDEFLSWYGPWESLTVPGVARLMDGFTGRWWIAGGHAIDAATGTRREHSDVDLVIAADDLARFRAHRPDLQLWEPHNGSLTPLPAGRDLTPGREQLWARRDATRPWLVDILLSPMDGTDWLFKRDHGIRLPAEAAIITREGVGYLAPQAVLLHKAHLLRDKDRRDFDVTVPLLDPTARAWLAAALDRHLPGHEWRDRLR